MKYKLQDLIDIKQFQLLLDRMNEIYSFTTAILDNDSNILAASGWQDICTKFHRVNPESEKECKISDQYILSHINEANPAVCYKCAHGLVDCAMPIIIDGVHYGNFFVGQYFLESPDLDFFRKQAKKYGFDKAEYLSAVKKTPILTNKQLNDYILFVKELIEIISDAGLKNLKEKEAREALKTSEEKYKNQVNFLDTITENSPFAMWISDTEGVLIRTNKSLRTILNVTDDQVIGKYNVLHDDNMIKQGLMPSVQSVFNELKTARFNMFWTGTEAGDADLSMARELWIDVSMFPVLDENGKLLNVVCQYVDITKRKRAEEELLKISERLELAMDAGEHGFWDWNLDTNDIYFSPCYYTMLGYEPGELPMKLETWINLMHPDDKKTIVPEVENYVKNAQSYEVEFRLKTKDGGWKWISGRGKSFKKDIDGVSHRAVGVHVDITDRKRAEQELQKLNKDLELRVAQRTQQLEATNSELQFFVYSVSHDLRAPLRSIMGFSEIISRRYIDNLNEEGLEYFGYVLEASKNMAALIEGLLLFSRLAKSPVEKELINLNEILQLVLQSLNQDIVENNAKIDIPDTLPEIKGDRALLSQIFTNLIQNAIMYHRAGMTPEVTLSVEDSKDNIIVKVSDNGQGIPEEHHKKIFNIFQRLHTNDECPGTGIGLAIVKKAVVALGGSITLESNVDKGSTFSVILPKN